MMRILTTLFVLVTAFVLNGCAKDISPDTYETSEIGMVSKVQKGVVISKRLVQLSNSSQAGGLGGTVGGAALGSSIGGSSQANIAGAIGGAIVGGVAGEAIDKKLHAQQGYEYIITLEDKQTISIVQNLDVNLAVKQPVLIIYGATTRIVPDTH